MHLTGLKQGLSLQMHEPWRECGCAAEGRGGSYVHFEGNGAKNRHRYPESINASN